MSTVLVTVEVAVNGLPDDAAREVARSLVEGKGLEVARVAIKAQPDRVKVFTPKAGKPGSTVVRDGRAYSVWADAPAPRALWLVPIEAREGDAPVYLSHNGGTARPHHSDGTACASSWRYPDGKPTEVPCSHKSHGRAEVAA